MVAVHIHEDDGTVEGCPGCFPGTNICPKCGSLVGDTSIHNRWHRKQDAPWDPRLAPGWTDGHSL